MKVRFNSTSCCRRVVHSLRPTTLPDGFKTDCVKSKTFEGFVRRTGRAELDEHAEGVNMSEYILELDPESPRSREEQLEEIREAMADIPGIVTAVEQPIAHLISHMISGVKAQIGIKIYGDDLDLLRRTAGEMEAAMQSVPGVKDLLVEPQVIIPQLRIELDRDKLLLYGLSAVEVNEFIETAMSGQVVSEILIGQRTFDFMMRLDEDYRENMQTLKRLTIDLADGGRVPLESVANIYESGGPNTINREDVRRRIVLQCNVSERGVVDVVEDIQKELLPIVESLPPGYFVQYSGQFESQQSASRVIGILFAVSLVGVFLVLYTMFRSVNLSLQVMVALPMAFIGGGGLGRHWPNADRRRNGRLHFARRDRVAERHLVDQPLLALRPARR